MKKHERDAGKELCVMLLLICMIFSEVSSAFANENATDSIIGSFFAFDHNVSWKYAYNEDFFRLPGDEYNHELARLSLGMALAAFRHTEFMDDQEKQDKELAAHFGEMSQDKDLIAYFEEMGFDQIETGTSYTDPPSYPISYGFARRTLDDMTVVALAVSGGNYGDDEWASNVTVGDDVRSEGFQAASQKVQEALWEYMKRHPASGDVKLWITGYSRGGAVANITAADCTDSGSFKNVYAYTFATPRTTREPGDYHNIFNIIKKNDVVPKIPLADWGYQRYGTDMFLAAPEIDIDREEVIGQARELYREMTGSEMVMNFEINYQMRILLDYLYLLMEDPATYAEYLQPILVNLLTQNDEAKDALSILLKALQSYGKEDEQHKEDLKALIDYLETLIDTYYLQDGIGKLPLDKWDPQYGTYNLFNEHFPFDYLALMYASDDPEILFSDNTRYLRLVIYGKVDAEIRSEGRTLKTILADGTELVDGMEDSDSLPDADYSAEKLVITLPANQSFTIRIRSKSFLPQTVTYTGLLFSGDTVRAEADDLYSYLMYAGETASILTSSNGRAIEPEASDHTDVSAYIDTIYSPTTAMRLENNNVIHLTISGFANKILFILVLLLAQMIVSIILAVIRKKKHRKRNALAALIWHSAVAAVFGILEVAMWYFVPVLSIAKFICAILIFIVILVYAWKGHRETGKDLKVVLILIGVLAVFDILESMIAGDFTVWKGIMLLIVYAGFMTASYGFLWKGNKKNNAFREVK